MAPTSLADAIAGKARINIASHSYRNMFVLIVMLLTPFACAPENSGDFKAIHSEFDIDDARLTYS
jgi:hypothetical protein